METDEESKKAMVTATSYLKKAQDMIAALHKEAINDQKGGVKGRIALLKKSIKKDQDEIK